MPLTDHVLLLQSERAIEALSDRVDELETSPEADGCDCDCADSDYDDLRGDIDALASRVATLDDECTELRSSLREASDIIVTLAERTAMLEDKLSTLIDALAGRLR